MKEGRIIGILITFLAIGITSWQTFFIVNEQQQVIITQFGEPVGEAITTPGLKLKVPFIQKANYFEKRYLEWVGDRNEVPTIDQEYIFIDAFARWQIVDPLRYFQRLSTEERAQSRLDDILDGETKSAVASNHLIELIRTSNDNREVFDRVVGTQDTLSSIEIGRTRVQNDILTKANERASELGIEILDFRFRRVNYTERVRETVYERMISERNRIADKFRSEGQGESSRINGEKDRELLRIQSEAFREAETIRGESDAQAAAIYNAAYNRNSAARELYAFLKTMEAYQSTIDSETSLIISTNSEFYKYLNSIDD